MCLRQRVKGCSVKTSLAGYSEKEICRTGPPDVVDELTDGGGGFLLVAGMGEVRPSTWVARYQKGADSSQVFREQAVLGQWVGQGRVPPILDLWVAGTECFVVGRSYLERMTEARRSRLLRDVRIPVVTRISGGEAILHDATCLNLAVVVPRSFWSGPVRTDTMFRTLSAGLVQTLSDHGISCRRGKVKRFCPGPHDLLVGGKKLVGLALACRRLYCMLHATVFVNTDRGYAESMAVFCRSVAEEITSLQALAGRYVSMEILAEELISGYSRVLGAKVERARFFPWECQGIPDRTEGRRK